VIWLTWRQFRTSAILVFAALAAMAVLLALTPAGTELARCAGHQGCPVFQSKFLGMTHNHLLQYLSTLLVGVPALLGAFWGAPLIARELESGTYRLVWTQSVTRRRWFLTKVVLIGSAIAACCGVLSVMLGAWSSASVNSDRLSPAMFGERGVAPIGYALFAFAVGMVAGVLIRRTVPAMATTLVVFIGVRMGVQFWLRPHLVPAKHVSTAIGAALGISQSPSGLSVFPGGASIPGAWVLSTRIVDNAGHGPTKAFLKSACGSLGGPPQASSGDHSAVPPAAVQHQFQTCTTKVAARFHELVTYQPASHYWSLQWAETGIFIALALALTGFAFWWVQDRLT
jgi:ABC-2 family transporter protein